MHQGRIAPVLVLRARGRERALPRPLSRLLSQVPGLVTDKWIVTMKGAEGSFYAGEVFRYS
jgi:hypothetical protein